MNAFCKSLHKLRIDKIYFPASLIFCAILGFKLYQTGGTLPASDKGNGGLFLPGGFEAVVVIDSIGGGPRPAPTGGPANAANRGGNPPASAPATPPPNAAAGPRPQAVRSNQGTPSRTTGYQGFYYGARHMAVNSNGDIYLKLRNHTPDGYGNVALRDNNNDGKADEVKFWGKYDGRASGTAMRIHNGYAYFSSDLMVFRSKLIPGTLIPEAKIDTIIIDDMGSHEHITKPVAFDGQGHIFVGWGAGSNSCQVFNRTQSNPGVGVPGDPNNPCPWLVDHAGVWMFDENKLKQTQKDGVRYATGLRSVVALTWDNASNSLYTVIHGRDDFAVTWPQYYNYWESAMLPSEEFFKVPRGFDGGWPYYYYDQIKGKKMLNPEYGGDGKKEGNGAKVGQPLVGFPGHFAPNDVLFYKGNQFPARYKDGAFIAMHGSTNRPPYPQAGYIIAFVPMKNGVVTGPWEVFADGIAGIDPVPTAGDAIYRPMGLAEGPDGSLYISETQRGKVWRVMFKGNKTTFGRAQLAGMAQRKLTASNIKTPDLVKDNLDRGKPVNAPAVYTMYCRTCHQANGLGDGNRFPPLAESEWVNGDKTKLINVVLNGLSGPITVKGMPYSEAMPAHGSFLTDEDIAQVLTYVRSNFGNTSGPVTQAEVAAVRKATAK